MIKNLEHDFNFQQFNLNSNEENLPNQNNQSSTIASKISRISSKKTLLSVLGLTGIVSSIALFCLNHQKTTSADHSQVPNLALGSACQTHDYEKIPPLNLTPQTSQVKPMPFFGPPTFFQTIKNQINVFCKNSNSTKFNASQQLPKDENACTGEAKTLLRHAEKDFVNPLLLAISENKDLSFIEFLVRNQADRTNVDKLLVFLSNDQAIANLNMLLQHQYDINQVDESGNSILHIAFSNLRERISEHRKFIRFLIEKGANLNLKNHYGKTPFEIAFNERWSLKTLNYLIEKGADIKHLGEKSYDRVLSDIRFESVNEYREANFNRFEFLTNHSIPFKDTLVCRLIELNRGISFIKLAIDSGADLRTKDVFGRRPIDLIKYRIENAHKQLHIIGSLVVDYTLEEGKAIKELLEA